MSSGALITAPLILTALAYSAGWSYRAWRLSRITFGMVGCIQVSRILLMRATLQDASTYPPANQSFAGGLALGFSFLLTTLMLTSTERICISDSCGIFKLRVLDLADLAGQGELLEEQPVDSTMDLCKSISSGWRPCSSSSVRSSDDYAFPSSRLVVQDAAMSYPLFRRPLGAAGPPATFAPPPPATLAVPANPAAIPAVVPAVVITAPPNYDEAPRDETLHLVSSRRASRYGRFLWRVLRCGHADATNPLSILSKDALRCIVNTAHDRFTERTYQNALRPRPRLFERLASRAGEPSQDSR